MAHVIGIADIFLKGVLNAPEGSSKDLSDKLLDINEKGKTYLRDTTKPVGDACRDDGTLKDADEMVWLNLPTELKAPQKDFHERYDYEPGSESESTRDNLPTAKVTLILWIYSSLLLTFEFHSAKKSNFESESTWIPWVWRWDNNPTKAHEGGHESSSWCSFDQTILTLCIEKKHTQIFDSDDEKSILTFSCKHTLESSEEESQDFQHRSKKAKKTSSGTETQRWMQSDVASIDETGSEDNSEPELKENKEGAKYKVCTVLLRYWWLMLTNMTTNKDGRQRKDPTKAHS